MSNLISCNSCKDFTYPLNGVTSLKEELTHYKCENEKLEQLCHILDHHLTDNQSELKNLKQEIATLKKNHNIAMQKID